MKIKENLKKKNDELIILEEDKKIFNENYKQNLSKIKKYLKDVDAINKKVKENNYDERLLIAGENNIGNDFSDENVKSILTSTQKNFDDLFSSTSSFDCVNLSKKIGEDIAYINDYLEYAKSKLDTSKIDEIKKEIKSLETKLQEQKEQKDKEKLKTRTFENSSSFLEDFSLYKFKDEDEFCIHNFSQNDFNLIFKHKAVDEKLLINVYENIFIRLIYEFYYSVFEIQPIGILPIRLKGLIGNVNKSLNNSNIFNESIIDEHEVDLYFTQLYDIMCKRAEKYYSEGDFFQYNLNHSTSPDKAIIIFLYNYPNFISEKSDAFIKTINNEDCKKYGIFFVVDYISDSSESRKSCFDELLNTKVFNEDNEKLLYKNREVSFDLYNDMVDKKIFFDELKEMSSNGAISKSVSVVKHLEPVDENGIDALSQMISENCSTSEFSDKLIIPIGKDNNNETVNISFETKNEKCSLIVAGGTGSGKSEFLHTLIMSSCLKYSPEQLNLYLIDFKDGVEFSPYSTYLQIPHIKLISCRNSVTDSLMILEEIKNEKIRRNELFKQNNCSNISQYNKKNVNNMIPRLLIIIDEYQVMLNSDSRLGSKCEDILESLAREIRSVGISLVLSSQTVACGRDILAQITNRVCFKVKDNSLSYLIDSLDDSDRDSLNLKPAGCGYFSNGEKVVEFCATYTGETDRVDGSGKDKYAKLIKNKFDNEIDFILSNDTRDLFFESNVINDEKDRFTDFGISVFNSTHLKLEFPLESENFSNYYLLGDKIKAIEVEYSILRNLTNKDNEYILNAFTFRSMKKPLIETGFMGDANWSSYSVEDLIEKINEIYDEYKTRMKIKANGDIYDNKVIVTFINSFNKSKVLAIESEPENNDNEFAWDKPSNDSTIDKIIELYKNSYQYGIYLFLHFDSKEQIKELFGFEEFRYDYAFYVDPLAVQFYIEKSLSGFFDRIEIENKTSIFVKDNVSYKFRRYKFE